MRLELCISNNFSVGADAAGLETTLLTANAQRDSLSGITLLGRISRRVARYPVSQLLGNILT